MLSRMSKMEIAAGYPPAANFLAISCNVPPSLLKQGLVMVCGYPDARLTEALHALGSHVLGRSHLHALQALCVQTLGARVPHRGNLGSFCVSLVRIRRGNVGFLGGLEGVNQTLFLDGHVFHSLLNFKFCLPPTPALVQGQCQTRRDRVENLLR